MKTYFEIFKPQADVISVSNCAGCIKFTNINTYECLMYDENGGLSPLDTVEEEEYLRYKNANGGKDLDPGTWYAVYLDEDYNIVRIRNHDEIGHYAHDAG